MVANLASRDTDTARPSGDGGAVYVGFASQKGGVGKSSLAEVLSSVLCYERGLRLAAVDCDAVQESFFKLRARERALALREAAVGDFLQGYYGAPGRPPRPYEVYRAAPGEALSLAGRVEAEARAGGEPLDVVVFDFPGHAGTAEVLWLAASMDLLISPVEADWQSILASLAYGQAVRDIAARVEGARLRDFLFLWNKVDRRASSWIIDYYDAYFAEQGVSCFRARVYASVRMSHELAQYGVQGVFRSSYLPPAGRQRAALGIDAWVDELLARSGLDSKCKC